MRGHDDRSHQADESEDRTDRADPGSPAPPSASTTRRANSPGSVVDAGEVEGVGESLALSATLQEVVHRLAEAQRLALDAETLLADPPTGKRHEDEGGEPDEERRDREPIIIARTPRAAA